MDAAIVKVPNPLVGDSTGVGRGVRVADGSGLGVGGDENKLQPATASATAKPKIGLRGRLRPVGESVGSTRHLLVSAANSFSPSAASEGQL
jgi:hypothetical protein